MAVRLEDKNRKFKRFRQSAKEKIQLARAGFQHVLSSNVSAIAKDENDLYVRFHGGATYRYSGKADLYEPMLQSNSKGRYVWKNLIRTKASYQKVGGVPLASDSQFTDKDLMERQPRKDRKSALSSVIKIQALSSLTNTSVLDSIITA